MTQIQKPTIGRIVHFVVAGGEHRAALVVNVLPEETTDCNLKVELDAFHDLVIGGPNHGWEGPALKPLVRSALQVNSKYFGGTDLHVTLVKQDEDGKAPGTWHWPERE